jgi:hypothetical protein
MAPRMDNIMFTTYNNSMLVLLSYDRRSISSIKNIIKRLGGTWNNNIRKWTFPLKMDTPELRAVLQAAYNIVHKKILTIRKPNPFYDSLNPASPINTLVPKEKVIDSSTHKSFLPIPPIRPVKTPLLPTPSIVEKKDDTSWMCCMECTVIDWYKQETYCSKCGMDGYNYRIKGRIYVPIFD